MSRRRSLSQMDNFYTALANGFVKTSGIMNYVQHLFIAQHCPQKARVLDLCCGRGLLIPLLCHYAPTVCEYVGIDLCIEHLRQGRAVQRGLASRGKRLPIKFIKGDVADLPQYIDGLFDCIVYTSALEHMPRKCGLESIRHAFSALRAGGLMFLSTPNTLDGRLQYKVHVFEWSDAELNGALTSCGFKVIEKIGLLPRDLRNLKQAAKRTYGKAAADFVDRLIATVPDQFLQPMLAAPFPSVAKEILYVCERPRR